MHPLSGAAQGKTYEGAISPSKKCHHWIDFGCGNVAKTLNTMTKQTIDKLTEEESWAIVKQNEIGRVASAREGAPDIYPVSFVVHNWCIYFRTGVDSRLRTDTEGKLVAFETAVQESHSFSSTVSLGVLSVVTEAQVIAELDLLPIVDFAPRTNYVWMALKPQELRGRRLNVLINGNDR